jgi:hypothetical protein
MGSGTGNGCKDSRLWTVDSGPWTPDCGLWPKDFGLLFRYQIATAAAPGMAPANSFHAEPRSFNRAVTRQGFERVLRATWRKPALPGVSEEERFCRRKDELIKPYGKHQNVLGRVHPLRHFNNPAFRNVVKKSRSTSANCLPAIDGRATKTRSKA